MERYIDVGGGAIWSCANGNGLPVLLCNGGPGCGDYLSPVSAMLEDDYQVIRFEQRGCGRSVCDGKYDLFTAIGDIEAVRQAYGVERWIVGGHSWGANLALAYAMTYPERVRALLYIAGNGIQNDRDWSRQYHQNLEERGETLPEIPFSKEVNALGNESLRALGREPDFYLRLSRLRIPAFFVMAGDDIRPSWPAEQLCSLMPNAQSVIIQNAGHFIWLDEAAALERSLQVFLTSI